MTMLLQNKADVESRDMKGFVNNKHSIGALQVSNEIRGESWPRCVVQVHSVDVGLRLRKHTHGPGAPRRRRSERQYQSEFEPGNTLSAFIVKCTRTGIERKRVLRSHAGGDAQPCRDATLSALYRRSACVYLQLCEQNKYMRGFPGCLHLQFTRLTAQNFSFTNIRWHYSIDIHSLTVEPLDRFGRRPRPGDAPRRHGAHACYCRWQH